MTGRGFICCPQTHDLDSIGSLTARVSYPNPFVPVLTETELVSETDSEWEYDPVVYPSTYVADQQSRASDPKNSSYQRLLVQFVEIDSYSEDVREGGPILACASSRERRIIKFLQASLDRGLEYTMPLHELADKAQPNADLSRSISCITKTLLHELCHIIDENIIDIGLKLSHVPLHFSSRQCSNKYPGPFFSCGDYECRILADCAADPYPHINRQVVLGFSYATGPCSLVRNGPMDNAESIASTLCSIYMHRLRPDLRIVTEHRHAARTRQSGSCTPASLLSAATKRQKGRRTVVRTDERGRVINSVMSDSADWWC